MTNTVPLDDETLSRLERLRAEWAVATGRRLSLEEVVRMLAERAVEHKDLLMPELVKDTPPQLSDEAWERVFALPRPWGVVIRPEDIDDIATEDTRR